MGWEGELAQSTDSLRCEGVFLSQECLNPDVV